MTDISWTEIKQFYQDKKCKWAKTRSYYKGNPLWAEIYGYTLLEPYTLEEITNYETQIQTPLPEELRSYLLLVSKEIFAGRYPMVFGLSTSHSNMEIGSFKLPTSIHSWNIGDCLSHDSWDKCSDLCLSMENDPCGGLIKIGENGCTDDTNIVIKGNSIGSIWSVGNGGDTLYREPYTSFYDYIATPIRKELF